MVGTFAKKTRLEMLNRKKFILPTLQCTEAYLGKHTQGNLLSLVLQLTICLQCLLSHLLKFKR